MNCYGPLAPWYDKLTRDVPYEQFADFYQQQFRSDGGEFRLLLDLCCGTGTLTGILARRGYEMIAVDASEDMLAEAQEKTRRCPVPPLYLRQEAAELDLYGTVDAAICSLDGMNYLPPEEIPQVLHRLNLFIRPGGLFIFDIRPEEFFQSLDGDVFVDETEDVLCLWRADFDPEEKAIVYGMDVFSRKGALWKREEEEHVEYAHSPEFLTRCLQEQGFRNIRFVQDGPQGDLQRVFVLAQNTRQDRDACVENERGDKNC